MKKEEKKMKSMRNKLIHKL